MRLDGRPGTGDKQAAGHAQVNDPLGVGRGSRRSGGLRPSYAGRSKLTNDMFAGAMDGENNAAFEALGLPGGRGLEGFAMGAEPCGGDPVAAHTLIDAAGDGFYFRELGHGNSVGDRRVNREKSLLQVVGQVGIFL